MLFGDGERQRVNRNTWIVTIVILAVWEAVCRLQWVPGVILPAPSAIAAAAGDSFFTAGTGAEATGASTRALRGATDALGGVTTTAAPAPATGTGLSPR